MNTQLVEYQDGESTLEGFVAWPEALKYPGPRPVVLVAHMWAGRVEFVCDKARELARLGYVGFALDMYGKGVIGQTPAENAALMGPFKADRALLQHRMRLAVDSAKSLADVDPVKIAAIGYCFGGLCVLDLARTSDDVAGVVSFHGVLDLPNNIGWANNTAKVLVLHGHDDPLVLSGLEQANKAQMTAAGVDWQFISLGNTVHAFTFPSANDPDFGAVYSEPADRRSWQYMKQFLTEVLDH